MFELLGVAAAGSFSDSFWLWPDQRRLRGFLIAAVFRVIFGLLNTSTYAHGALYIGRCLCSLECC